MKLLKRLADGITKANFFAAKGASVFIFPVILLLVFEIFMRLVLSSPTEYTYDLAWMLNTVFVFLGGGYVLAQNMHAKADVFYNKMKRRGQKIVNLICYPAFFFLTVGALLYSSYHSARMSWITQDFAEWTAWNPKLWPIKTMMVICVVLLALQGFVKFAELMGRGKGGEDNDA